MPAHGVVPDELHHHRQHRYDQPMVTSQPEGSAGRSDVRHAHGRDSPSLESVHSHDDTSSIGSGAEVRSEIVLYTRRWFMLGLFCLLSFSNALMWITYAPVATLWRTFWGTTEFAVNALSLVYMIVYVPGVFVASWIVDSRSLRLGVALGAILNAVGAVWRTLPYPFVFLPGSHPYSYAASMIGQVLASVAQTFILAMPPKVAQNWFGERERVTATAIGALFNQAGVAVGFVLGPAIVSETTARLPLLLAVEAALALVVLALCITLFRSAPPSPPSRSAAGVSGATIGALGGSGGVSVLRTLRHVLTDGPFILLTLSFGIGIGAFYAVSTILDFFSAALGYSTSDSGLFGLLLVAVGMAGAILCGLIADRTRLYRLVVTVTTFGSAACMVWVSLAAQPNQRTMLCAAVSVLGFFMTAVLPVGMDLSVEISYPLPEATTSGVLLSSANLFGIVFTVALTYTLPVSLPASVWGLTGAVAVAALLLLCFRPVSRRLAAEAMVTAATPDIQTYGSVVPVGTVT